MFSIPVNANEEIPSFSFILSVDGKETKEVHQGDIITVTLKLKRTDSEQEYTMYAMQDEIQYDSDFFELVEDGVVLKDGLVSEDIATIDKEREFYMNYLSMSGGSKWDADTWVGNFQLKVIAESGVTKICQDDYLVSLPDGSESYKCDANEVMIVLSTDCTVRFMTNGGNVIEDQIVQYGEKMRLLEVPVREGYVFDGWYKDIHLLEQWDIDNDVVEENMSLYAKWKVADTINTNSTNAFWGYVIGFLVILLLIIVIIFIYLHKKIKKRKE